jgi:hypothetical protein
MNWVIAETKARLVVISFFWFCAMIFTIRYEMCGNENVDASDQERRSPEGRYDNSPAF